MPRARPRRALPSRTAAPHPRGIPASAVRPSCERALPQARPRDLHPSPAPAETRFPAACTRTTARPMAFPGTPSTPAVPSPHRLRERARARVADGVVPVLLIESGTIIRRWRAQEYLVIRENTVLCSRAESMCVFVFERVFCDVRIWFYLTFGFYGVGFWIL